MPDSDFFSDLPSENDKPVEQPDGSGAKNEEEKARETEEIRNLEKAKKAEDARIAKLKKELDDKRKERQALAKKKDEPEEPEEPEAPVSAPQAVDVKESVEAALREREETQRKADLAARIKKIAKTRQEAEAIYAEALNIPSSGDLDLDVDFAADRVQKLRDRRRGYTQPSVSGGSFGDMDNRGTDAYGNMSPEGKAFLRNSGVKPEDVARLRDERGYFRNLYKK